MLTLKDRIEQFKRECRSESYYQRVVQELEQKIEEIDTILTGVSSPGFDLGSKAKNGKNKYGTRELELMLKLEGLIQERDNYVYLKRKVSNTLRKIKNEDDRKMIEDLYVKNLKQEHVALKYNFASRSAMFYHINNILSEIL